MVEIQPAILAHSEEEFMMKVTRVRAIGAPLHIDVMDGVFVNNTTWAPPEKMRSLLDCVEFEAHLMVANPEQVAPLWLAAGARRVIVHAETTHSSSLCDKKNISIALNPDTPISHAEHCENICVMGVMPGWSGQPFQEIALEKIVALKKENPSCKITVDGGVKLENIRAIAEAGADVIVIGSALTDAENPETTYRQFKERLG